MPGDKKPAKGSPVPRPTVCVPARWGASRLPGKLLLPWDDGTVLSTVIRSARAVGVDPVHVLCDDDRLAAEATKAGATAVRIDEDTDDGTGRVALAVARGLVPPSAVTVNLQADAIGAPGEAIIAACEALRADRRAAVATVAVWGRRSEHRGRTTLIASATTPRRALWFSRHPLPMDRDDRDSPLLFHLGIYAYRSSELPRLAGLPASPAQRAERLEQLRWLEHGVRIALAILDGPASWADAVDTQADCR